MQPWPSILLLIGALGAALLPGGAADDPPAPACEPSYIPDVGLACREGHLFRQYAPDGTFLGYTHGPDPAPMDTRDVVAVERDGLSGVAHDPCASGACHGAAMPDLLPFQPPGHRDVHCVDGLPGEHHVQFVYTRAFDDRGPLNGWQHTDLEVDLFFQGANAWIDQSAGYQGDRADLRVKCMNGQAELKQLILYTPIDYTDFGSIRADLRAHHGLNDPATKYWVYFDDTRGCSCAGMAEGWSDPDPGAGNPNNNGNMYAVTWDPLLFESYVILHEGTHTMGGVQDTATAASTWLTPPHASLGFHCYDAMDVMCYDDGGANATLYPTMNCQDVQYDCGMDDYFNTRPTPENYLHDNWNIGNKAVNRYIAFDASTMDWSRCTEDAFVDVPVACAFSGGNPGATAVDYRIDWGDSTSMTLRGDQGVPVEASHVYATPGTYLVHIYAKDAGTPWTNESGGHPWLIKVRDSPDLPVGGGLG